MIMNLSKRFPNENMTIKRGKVFILFLVLLISISFISASPTKGNKSHEITTIYGPGNTLSGWINISLKNEPINSLFEDNKGNSISLINLLKSDISLSENTNYNCSIPKCGMTYSTTGSGEESKTFLLPAGDEKIIGFKLSGDISEITNVSFDILSDAGASCQNQLEIDFFADGEIDYGNDKALSISCPQLRDNGCFNSSKSAIPFNMVGNGEMYCQKIELSESPGFKLNAWIKIISGAKKIKMGIYDLNSFGSLAECELNNTLTDWAERSCNVNYSVIKADEYYICIFNDEGTDTNTQIKGYIDNVTGCGFHTSGGIGVENRAFNISAEGRKFGAVGKINITEYYPLKEGLSDEFYNYIYDTYSGDNCPSDGCIIPLQFNSNSNQNITIENVAITYDIGGSVTENKIYNLSLISSTVSTGNKFMQISLNNGNFTLPTKIEIFTYRFDLDGSKIFEEKLSIEKVPNIKYLMPSYGFNQIPIEFTVKVELVDNASITNYVWQFGNATPKTTTVNKATHSFASTGPFPIKITVTDAKSKTGSKIFYFEVKSYLLYFTERVEKVKENLENIESQISNFSDFYKGGINKTIDIQGIRRQLTNLESRYETAVTDNDFNSVVSEFLVLESRVPKSVIEKIKTDSVSFYPNVNNIEMGIIKEVLGGDYDTTKSIAYKDAVLNWNVENINSKVKYSRITSEYEDGRSEPILNVFELDLTKIGNVTGTIFIRELENIKFDKSYGEKVKSGYVYIPLDSSKKIKFYTTQDIDMLDLPAFVSPAISELTVIEEISPAEEARMKWLLFFLIMFFLVIVAIIVYVVLQQWYKYKYETYLFKNRNFLFNLIHYIDAQKKKGEGDSEIFSKLKKSGWTSEQINYVMRKYVGKRTGMLELPIEKILGIFRKKSEQPGVPSAPGPAGPSSGFQFRPRL